MTWSSLKILTSSNAKGSIRIPYVLTVDSTVVRTDSLYSLLVRTGVRTPLLSEAFHAYSVIL
jgi:hypothetical protein